MQNQSPPLVLTFGAADPIGAVGIQADLGSFAAMGCHGVSVITSILISDTTRIEDMQRVDPDWVADQARVVLEDMPVAAFKVGLPGSIETVSVIAEIVSDYPEVPLVLDPFVSGLPESGEDGDDLLVAMRELLLPQATLLLVSATELGRLAETWREPSNDDLLAVDAMSIIDMGCEFVFVTGVHGDVHAVNNSLFGESGLIRRDGWHRLPGVFTGAGNTMSATITAMLANGMDVAEAVFEAQEFAHAALTSAQRLGMGKLIPDRFFWTRDADAAPADTEDNS